MEDSCYYIDFSPVTGERIIESMRRTIRLSKPDRFTRQLITGYTGCGKSMELLQLKSKLTQDGFHVVYFRFEQNLIETDTKPTDAILLNIAHQVIKDLKKDFSINLEPNFFEKLYIRCTRLINIVLGLFHLQLEFEAEREISQIGKVKISIKQKDAAKNFSKLEFWTRLKLSNNVVDFVNEVLCRATKRLKNRKKRGLVVIVDDLDRLDKLSSSSLSEQVFIDQNETLSRLDCHIIYTIPLSLIYSKKYEILKRLGGGIDPKILRSVPIQSRSGSRHLEGITLLKQVVLSRAFPYVEKDKRLNLINQLFDSQETLERLCKVSGGRIQKLLELLSACLQRTCPQILVRRDIEYEIEQYCNNLLLRITDDERKLIYQIAENITVEGRLNQRDLLLLGIQSGFLLEYKDRSEGSWFSLDPTLEEIKEFQRLF